MAKTINIRSATPANIKTAIIFSNEDESKNADLRGGLIRLQYYESILQDTVRATLIYSDSGDTIKKGEKRVSAVEGLPIVGQEKLELIFEDNNENEISFTEKDNNALYVNKITPIIDDTTRSLVMLDLVSKEYILNEKIRLNTRFDGSISEHVKGILTDMEFGKDGKKVQKNYLNTKKDVDVEETVGEYNFCGNNKKPFYTINWLSKKAVPNKANPKALGNSAGYFLWETSEGYQFKSIDWLMNKETNPKKKSIIYNDTPDGKDKLPQGYDIKALAAEKDNRIDIQKKLMMGAFSTRTVMFNPFNSYYEVIAPNAYGVKLDSKTGKPVNPKGPKPKGDQRNLKLAGEKLPVLNKEFDMDKREGGSSEGPTETPKEFSRTQFMCIDSGTLVADGSKDPKSWVKGTKAQLKLSQTQRDEASKGAFEIKEILSQSSMRYNQLFSTKISVTIAGDFSLHAGNSIFFDGPELTGDDKKDEIDQKDGGLYIIADICHYSTSKETYTKMNLVRDSTERTGTATGG